LGLICPKSVSVFRLALSLTLAYPGVCFRQAETLTPYTRISRPTPARNQVLIWGTVFPPVCDRIYSCRLAGRKQKNGEPHLLFAVRRFYFIQFLNTSAIA